MFTEPRGVGETSVVRKGGLIISPVAPSGRGWPARLRFRVGSIDFAAVTSTTGHAIIRTEVNDAPLDMAAMGCAGNGQGADIKSGIDVRVQGHGSPRIGVFPCMAGVAGRQEGGAGSMPSGARST